VVESESLFHVNEGPLSLPGGPSFLVFSELDDADWRRKKAG
jgi:hypothetical protein